MVEVPFNKQRPVGRELEYFAQAVESGSLSGDGPFTARCAELLETELGVPKVLLTTSCTHALEISALLLELEEGDEVILPSFTFVSTANAFVLRGARPIFVDIRPDTLNLDEALLEEKITERTRAIVPVHYAGVGCEMDRILEIAARREIPVIEDAAHALFGKYRGKALGTFGSLATLSFHETKNFTCGEGGALLLNDPELIDRAEILREKGTNRSRFFRGEVDKYTWVDTGSSYLPADLLAAYLLGQLEKRNEIQEKRRKIWEYYSAELAGWAPERGIQLPTIPSHCDSAYHLFSILCPTAEKRDELITGLRRLGVATVFHYLPLHSSPMGRSFGYQPDDCPLTQDVSARLLRLPFYYALTREEQDRVRDELDAVTRSW